MIKIFKYFLLLSLILGCSCFYSLQSFNHGKLLSPGQTKSTIGFGYRQVEFENYTEEKDTLLRFYGYDYKLGLLHKYPFGKGMECGFHVEFPVQYEWPLIEFDLRFGLPEKQVGPFLLHHNVSVGWVAGRWIDNGWYLEYAIGLERSEITPYFSCRALLMPTNADLFDSDTLKIIHNRKFVSRAALGCSFTLPRVFLMPDLIIPEFSLAAPDRLSSQNYSFGFHIGFGWLNGF